LAFVFAALLRC